MCPSSRQIISMQSQTLDVLVNGWKGKVFYNTHVITAQKEAKEYAQPHGKLLTIRELVQERIRVILQGIPSPHWRNWYTGYGEEDLIQSPQRKTYLFLFHGCGILTPRRNFAVSARRVLSLEQAVPLTKKESHTLFAGKLSHKEVPVYGYEDFWKTRHFPDAYAIALERDHVQHSKNGRYPLHMFYNDPLFHARIGHPETAIELLDLLGDITAKKEYASWHPYERINLDVPQARVPFIGRGTNGILSIFSSGGFVGIKTRIIDQIIFDGNYDLPLNRGNMPKTL